MFNFKNAFTDANAEKEYIKVLDSTYDKVQTSDVPAGVKAAAMIQIGIHKFQLEGLSPEKINAFGEDLVRLTEEEINEADKLLSKLLS